MYLPLRGPAGCNEGVPQPAFPRIFFLLEGGYRRWVGGSVCPYLLFAMILLTTVLCFPVCFVLLCAVS